MLFLSKFKGTMKFWRKVSSRVRWIFFLVVVLGVLLVLLSTSWDKVDEKSMWKVKDRGTRRPELSNTKADIALNKPRLNVIILTHMSSGSTFFGNLFNLHPDVFYVYEPLHALRRRVHRDSNFIEWNVLDKKAEDAYRTDFSNLLPEFFTCTFQGNKTIDYLFPGWLRRKGDYLAWRSKDTKFTKESVSEVCKSKRITVAKIMQTRLPGKSGIRDIQRVCSSEPDKFDCFIIHLVRDPRAVISSLIKKKFYMRKVLTTKNTPHEVIRHNSAILCSLIQDNLNYVNEEWYNWFRDRYILVRYEDVSDDLVRVALQLYNLTGLPMVASIRKWILEGLRPLGVTSRNSAFVISEKDTARTEHWRYRLDTSQVTEFEELCGPVMNMMGYKSINGSERLLNDTTQKLWTEKMPLKFPW